MSGSLSVAKSKSFALTIKLPRAGSDRRPPYVITCVYNAHRAVSEAEIDLFDAILKQRSGGTITLFAAASNDDGRLAAATAELIEAPQA